MKNNLAFQRIVNVQKAVQQYVNALKLSGFWLSATLYLRGQENVWPGTSCRFDVSINQHGILDLPRILLWKLIFLTHFFSTFSSCVFLINFLPNLALVRRVHCLHSCILLTTRARDGLSVLLMQDLAERERMSNQTLFL